MKTITLEELGKEFGAQKKPRKSHDMVCRKCGAVMNHIPGTNVYICGGTITEEGKEPKPCGNRVLTRKPD